MNKDEVMKLAKLARIEISEKEAESLTGEFESILGYVSEVKKATSSGTTISPSANGGKNVMREDAQSHESGEYTQTLLEQAPAREGDYIKVKKII